MRHLEGVRYALTYNIDGVSWIYEARFDEAARSLAVERVLVGEGDLAGGVHHGLHYDEGSGGFALAFCTATDPTQLYVLPSEAPPVRRTRERVLGLALEHLSVGEDASFESHDGLRVSARLYRPSPELGYDGPRPLVYYIHGGPQSQERPNFAWFSMPLIQVLTLEGFAVFVPNARGSRGYGLDYMKRVDRDWGGLDMADHVHAMTEVLAGDEHVDTARAGVVGRSYGGYMTLMLASRHTELWRAAVDMFGPYDLITFSERIPETWKPYFALALGDPEADRDFLVERSPRTRIEEITAPLLVIQGQNDPRVVEQESRDLVEHLRGQGKRVDYLVFEDEGHDVLKLGNRVTCYGRIVGFFAEHLA
jgi:dipeptidyl aminopeptidase/acylaminoacyl peptidase